MFTGQKQLTTSLTLEEILIDLTRYGHPRISHFGSGWRCSVEMNTCAHGTSCNVGSDFGQPTPKAAAQECYERVKKAIDAVKMSASVEGLLEK